MPQLIALDSAPLSLLTQRKGVVRAEECRQWLSLQVANNTRVMIPEIIDYEIRRELLRAGKLTLIARLDRLIAHPRILYQPLGTEAVRMAARLWAEVRQRGLPTAEPASLDIDCILAAQALTTAAHLSIDASEVVIATPNVGHLSRFLRAEMWENI